MDEFQKLQEWARTLDPDDVGRASSLQDLAGREKKFLYDITSQLRRRDPLSHRQLRYLRATMDKVGVIRTAEAAGTSGATTTATSEVKHLSVRLAWHDSGWDGRICTDPAANVYCVGEHSLLSDRIRRRRDLEIESRDDCRGRRPEPEATGGYLPPCFWSINAFSPEALRVAHDNPAAPLFPKIPEEIPPYSVLSWPFRLSFVRTRDEEKQYGKYYPERLFEARIEHFQAALRPRESLVFLYCKFSNPVSGEDWQYLLVGCALLSDVGPSHHFQPSASQLRAIRTQPRMQNFPTLNRYVNPGPTPGRAVASGLCGIGGSGVRVWTLRQAGADPGRAGEKAGPPEAAPRGALMLPTLLCV